MCTIMGYCGKGGSTEEVAEVLKATVSRGPDYL